MCTQVNSDVDITEMVSLSPHAPPGGQVPPCLRAQQTREHSRPQLPLPTNAQGDREQGFSAGLTPSWLVGGMCHKTPGAQLLVPQPPQGAAFVCSTTGSPSVSSAVLIWASPSSRAGRAGDAPRGHLLPGPWACPCPGKGIQLSSYNVPNVSVGRGVPGEMGVGQIGQGAFPERRGRCLRRVTTGR